MRKESDPSAVKEPGAARLAALLDACEDAIVGLTPEGIIDAWNAAAEDLYGYSAAEAIGQRLATLVAPQRREEYSRILERVGSGEPVKSLETVQTSKDGRVIPLRLSVTPIKDVSASVIGACFIAHAAAGAKQAQQLVVQPHAEPEQTAAVEEGRKILEALVGALPEGMAIFYEENHVLLRIGKNGVELAGHEQKALRKLTMAERAAKLGVYLDAGTCRASAEGLPLPSARSGNAAEGKKITLRDPEGRPVSIVVNASLVRNDNGKITGAVVTWRGDTESGYPAQELGEERYRTLVEWAPDAVIVHRKGRFLYGNCPALGLYGASTRAQLQAINFYDMVHPEDLEAARHQLEQTPGEERIVLREFRLARPDWREITVEAASVAISYEGGPAHLVILRDVTQRKRMEQERLRAIEDQLQQEGIFWRQGRFAAMGEMIANIAHQWRQPLNHLGLIVQELRIYYQHGRFDEEYLNTSVDKAMLVIGHMSRTIDDFRNFFRTEKARTQFQVREVLLRTISMVEPLFSEEGLQFQIEVVDDVSVGGGPTEYSQVILNILLNAKDALLEREVKNPLIKLRLFEEGGKAVLTITDNAGGIPDDIIGKVFDPYFTTKGPDKGTGIGLFMSKAIIERSMGGSLKVSNVAGGAEFRVEV